MKAGVIWTWVKIGIQSTWKQKIVEHWMYFLTLVFVVHMGSASLDDKINGNQLHTATLILKILNMFKREKCQNKNRSGKTNKYNGKSLQCFDKSSEFHRFVFVQY